MGTNDREEHTQFLSTLGEGEAEAAEKLLPEVYTQLRNIAGNYFRNQNEGQSL